MFPTEPIERYIRLASSKSIDELARVRATEVAEAGHKFTNRSGARLRAITQPSVNFTKSRINCWIQIVRDACKEANRTVDNEVRAYMRAEVHNMCDAAKKHTAQALALTIQQEGMQNIPGVQESLLAQFDLQISQIESEVRRELKLEELKEDVQKSAELPPPLTHVPISRVPAFLNVPKRPWYRRLSTDQKIAIGVGGILLAVAIVTLAVMVLLPEIRSAIGLDPTLTLDLPSQQQTPKIPPFWDSKGSPRLRTPATASKPIPVSKVNPEPNQSGHDNVQTGPITQQGACNAIQQGGSGNQQIVDCGPPPLKLTWSVRPASPDGAFAYRQIVTVEANIDFHPVSFAIYCDREIKDVSPGGTFFRLDAGITSQSNKIGYVYYENPSLAAGVPLMVTVSSTEPFNVLKVEQHAITPRRNAADP